VRNDGKVPRGSPAARVAEASSTPEVRELYRRACRQNDGWIQKGSEASRKQAEEAKKMRPWPSEITDERSNPAVSAWTIEEDTRADGTAAQYGTATQ